MFQGSRPPMPNGDLIKTVGSFGGACNRIYLAIAMWHVVKLQQPIWDVARKFEIDSGFLEGLLQSASVFCHQLATYCQGSQTFWAVAALLTGLVKRLHFGASEELGMNLAVPILHSHKKIQSRPKQPAHK
eukprot:m.291722 g.291722  ORF g.291722 m.291722 type:complete len:130 (-) comp15829_c0_seq7:820-1209(-)